MGDEIGTMPQVNQSRLLAIRDTLHRRTMLVNVKPDGTRETLPQPVQGCARVPRADLVELMSHPDLQAALATPEAQWLKHIMRSIRRAGPMVLLTLEYIRELIALIDDLVADVPSVASVAPVSIDSSVARGSIAVTDAIV
jgi:hypothetical protein